MVNDCEALFFPPHVVGAGETVGLLSSRACSRQRCFAGSATGPEAWQTAGYAIASYDFKDDRYTWGADAGVATFTRVAGRSAPALAGPATHRLRLIARGPDLAGVWRTAIRACRWAWFGMNPVMNLGPFYDLEGRAQSLNAAYGIQSKAELMRDVCPESESAQPGE